MSFGDERKGEEGYLYEDHSWIEIETLTISQNVLYIMDNDQ